MSPQSPQTPGAAAPVAAAATPAPPIAGELQLPTAPPTLSGLLWKKGSTFGGWTQRYYRLHPEMSRIFYSKGEEVSRGGTRLLVHSGGLSSAARGARSRSVVRARTLHASH
jgi:hypothetical protein